MQIYNKNRSIQNGRAILLTFSGPKTQRAAAREFRATALIRFSRICVRSANHGLMGRATLTHYHDPAFFRICDVDTLQAAVFHRGVNLRFYLGLCHIHGSGDIASLSWERSRKSGINYDKHFIPICQLELASATCQSTKHGNRVDIGNRDKGNTNFREIQNIYKKIIFQGLALKTVPIKE